MKYLLSHIFFGLIVFLFAGNLFSHANTSDFQLITSTSIAINDGSELINYNSTLGFLNPLHSSGHLSSHEIKHFPLEIIEEDEANYFRLNLFSSSFYSEILRTLSVNLLNESHQSLLESSDLEFQILCSKQVLFSVFRI
jgi:hypothetical protein